MLEAFGLRTARGKKSVDRGSSNHHASPTKAGAAKAEPVAANTATAASRALFERAKKVLAGGVSSSARLIAAANEEHLLYFAKGHGARIQDVDGHEYIDCLLSYGSVILGHADPSLTAALVERLRTGTMFGTCNPIEVELAELLCKLVPTAERVRFANSGSEAMLGAVRAARGYTGRNKILKFEGHYHGWVDVLAVSNRPAMADAGPLEAPHSLAHSRGTPETVVQDIIICPWNEPQILRDLLDAHGGAIGTMVAEPIVANNACIMPADGFLELLREECDRRKMVLIFDEIVTGFRIAPGGVQEVFGVVPDIAVYSKALGGGVPISAFAGREAVMQLVAANVVKHGGTYNGNPLCAAAALHTLRRLSAPGVIDRLAAAGQRIIEAIRRAAFDRGVPCIVQGMGSMFQVVFTTENDAPPLRHYRDLSRMNLKRYEIFRNAMLREGVLVNSSPLACWFVSTAHGSDEIDLVISAVEQAMDDVKGLNHP